jgi:signal peptidase I
VTPPDPWNAATGPEPEVEDTKVEDTKADEPEKPSPGPVAALFGLVRELALVLVIALGLSLLIKTFLVQAFFIPSPSMENTLLTGDRVLVSKLTPGPFDLHRGDIVVFKDPGGWLGDDEVAPSSDLHKVLSFVGLVPSNSDDHLIKRVIGLPGDKVACCDDQGRVTVNGVGIDEPYLYPGDEPSEKTFSVTVPAGHVWVLGDHRSVSQDSRFHLDLNNGMVPESNIVGRAFVNVWPLSRFTLLRNPSSTFAGVPAP